MKSELLQQHQLVQFPAVIGGIVPVVNLPEIKPGKLKLSGKLLAEIFLGKIKKWNDPDLVALNPTLPLPNKNIIVIHRSDGSGTTFGFTNYLSKVSNDWKNQVGEGKSVKWLTGQGGKGMRSCFLCSPNEIQHWLCRVCLCQTKSACLDFITKSSRAICTAF